MRQYRQLTEEERIEIYAMKQAGKEQNKIAAKLGVHPSTIRKTVSESSSIRQKMQRKQIRGPSKRISIQKRPI